MKKLSIVAIACSFLLCSKVSGQSSVAKKDSTLQKKDTLKFRQPKRVHQIDLYDIAGYLFHLHLNRSDTMKVPPGRLLLAFVPAIGYTLEAGFEGSLTLNVSFYTADQDSTNLSVLYSLVQYSVNNQLVVPIMSRIWLKKNKYQLVGDTRFFSYPSKTYGLGSTSTLSTVDNVNYFYMKVHQEALRHFGAFYYAGIGYSYDNHWDIRDFDNLTDYPLYNGSLTQTISSGPCVTFKFDNRTNSNNPDSGLFASILYRYNSTLVGSQNDWQYLEFEVRKFFPLSKRHRLILALWNLDRYAYGGYVPYFDLPSNGFGTEHYTSRGYIQSRFRGNAMLYDEGELRFDITRNGFLGGAIFANGESFTNWPDENINAIFPGGGLGLRFKFNKFSKVNVCVDYAWGVGNSHGLFFNLGEVF